MKIGATKAETGKYSVQNLNTSWRTDPRVYKSEKRKYMYSVNELSDNN